MAFIIKNPHKHVVHVGAVTLTPGEQLTCQTLNDAINDAADRGDITVTDATETPAELKSDAEALKPFKVGDPAIDGN